MHQCKTTLKTFLELRLPIDKIVTSSEMCFSTYAHKLCNFTVAVGVVPFAIQATPGCSHLIVISSFISVAYCNNGVLHQHHQSVIQWNH